MTLKEHTYRDIDYRGSIEKVRYTTTNMAGETVSKYANVYYPYGYDADPDKKYNILYLMHGGGGSPDAWLDTCMVKNMLDKAFYEGETEPFAVAFITYYKGSSMEARANGVNGAWEKEQIDFFMPEVLNDLMPAVESNVRTYAETLDEAGFSASRKHRAFGGFSMGSETTWTVFMNYLNCFSYFVPMSGNSWAAGMGRDEAYAEKIGQIMEDIVKQQGYTKDDFSIFAATGTKDPANTGLSNQIAGMKTHTGTFVFSEDFSEGNLHFILKEDAVHSYADIYQYLYNYLPYLFK